MPPPVEVAHLHKPYMGHRGELNKNTPRSSPEIGGTFCSKVRGFLLDTVTLVCSTLGRIPQDHYFGLVFIRLYPAHS